MYKTSFLTALMFASVSAYADVTPSAIFADHMVLQRDLPVSVYGLAEPGEEVTVDFAGQKKSGTTGKDGGWTVKLDAMKACTDPATMTVTGKNTLVLSDVVVGDVWICSGQSNMDFTPGAYSGPNDPKPYDEKDFDFPLLRQFHLVNEPSMRPESAVKVNRGNGTSEESAAWLPCKPTTGTRFTAVGLYFGRKLQMETGVPIGLIKTAWNGTRIEPWISPAGLAAVPELPAVTGLPAEYKSDGGYPSTWHCLYNGKIHPLTRYGIKGAIWYQGESNGDEGEAYYQKLRALIGGWRTAWGEGDFPFYIVQLAGRFHSADTPAGNDPAGGDGWARIRMAQFKALSIPHTGMAVAMDLADVRDPGDIHPKNKRDVGERLALWALAKDYGKKDLVYSGPLYREMQIEDEKIRITFDSVGSGLTVATKKGFAPVVKEPQGKLQRFAIAGEDMKWAWADAVIDGKTVVVSSPAVPKPVAVRYAYGMSGDDCNLYNKEGLPASPFRTDVWEK
jgi:sialate O-acetylesterase